MLKSVAFISSYLHHIVSVGTSLGCTQTSLYTNSSHSCTAELSLREHAVVSPWKIVDNSQNMHVRALQTSPPANNTGCLCSNQCFFPTISINHRMPLPSDLKSWLKTFANILFLISGYCWYERFTSAVRTSAFLDAITSVFTDRAF